MLGQIHTFWFGPVNQKRYEYFIRTFTLTFILYTFFWFQNASEWLGPSSFHLTAAINYRNQIDPFPRLSPFFISVFGFLLFGSALAVICNTYRTIALCSTLVCAVYIDNADPISSFSLNKIYVVVFAVLTFHDLSVRFDFARKEYAWPQRILQLTILCQYFAAGLSKVFHGDWLSDPLILWSQAQGHYCTDLCAVLLRILPPEGWSILMYGGLLFEILAPVLFAINPARRIGIMWGLIFHLAIALLMDKLIFFSCQMMSFYVLFLNDQQIQRITFLAQRLIKRG